jgi:hypothetical protein
MLRRPDELGAEEQVKLKQVLATCPHLETPPRTSPRCLDGRD